MPWSLAAPGVHRRRLHPAFPALLLVVLAFDPLRPAPAADAVASLGLDAAIARALARHAAIPAASERLEAARWTRALAARRPNPQLEADLENFGGSAPSRRSESSLLLRQPFELGGDRRARTGLADAELGVRGAELDHARRAVALEAVDRFLAAWTLQEQVRTLRAAEAVAAASVQSAAARLRAGAAPEFEHVRAEGFLVQRSVERARTESELGRARNRLAGLWNDARLGEDSLALGEPSAGSPPDTAALAAAVESHPDVRRAEAERRARMWRIAQERAGRVPDLDVGAGLRRQEETGGTGLVVGVGLPLPLWGPRGDAVRAAEAEARAAESELRLARLNLRQEAGAAATRLAAAQAALADLRERVQPAAQRALDLIQAGYRSGRLTYLDVIDGERSLIEANLLVTGALADAWLARQQLEILVNGPPSSQPDEGVKR